ncbi:MAG: hypothetical protein RL701_3835, partial [Pseudomonadota bacterium]
LVMPGNNDVEEYPYICAELTYRKARAGLLADVLLGEFDASPSAGHTRICGYSLHPLELNGLRITIIAARPFSMGGPDLGFPDALARTYGVRTLAESCTRLRALIDAVTTEHVVFLAHNGPTGLGARADDIWGRDFHSDAGDWGDPDLRDAIDYARKRSLHVLAVVAGHMHWGLRDQRAQRRWQLHDDTGTLFINASRVPRVFEQDGATMHHHVELRLTPTEATAREQLIRMHE